MPNAERVQGGELNGQLDNEIVRAFYEISPDGLLAITAEGEILSFNDRFLEIWGDPRGSTSRFAPAALPISPGSDR